MSSSLLITLSAQIFCQLLKVILYSIKYKELQLVRFISAGGMPSSHCAFVTALILSVGLIEGWDSNIFTVSIVLATIVVFDTIRLRRTVDMHSAILAKLNNTLKNKYQFSFPVVGHTNLEVISGILIGAGLSCGSYYLFIY